MTFPTTSATTQTSCSPSPTRKSCTSALPAVHFQASYHVDIVVVTCVGTTGLYMYSSTHLARFLTRTSMSLRARWIGAKEQIRRPLAMEQCAGPTGLR